MEFEPSKERCKWDSKIYQNQKFITELKNSIKETNIAVAENVGIHVKKTEYNWCDKSKYGGKEELAWY